MKNLLHQNKHLMFILLSVTVFACNNTANTNSVVDEGSVKDSIPIVDPQIFQINQTRDTLLKCEMGTEIFVPAGSFELDDTQLTNDTVQLRVVEAYTPGALIANHFTTLTNSGQLMETAGMLHIQALVNERNVRLKKNTYLEVALVNISPDDNRIYNTYNGNKTEGKVLWDSVPIGKEHQSNLDSVYHEDGPFEIVKVNDEWKLHKKVTNRLMKVNQLGYLNCDLILVDDIQNLKITYKTPKNKEVCTHLIYKDRKAMQEKSILTLPSKEESHEFGNIRKGEEVRLFSYYFEGAQLYLYDEVLQMSSSKLITPTYKKIDIVTFNRILDNIDW